jgi:predicted nucleotidyltransferase
VALQKMRDELAGIFGRPVDLLTHSVAMQLDRSK